MAISDPKKKDENSLSNWNFQRISMGNKRLRQAKEERKEFGEKESRSISLCFQRAEREGRREGKRGEAREKEGTRERRREKGEKEGEKEREGRKGEERRKEKANSLNIIQVFDGDMVLAVGLSGPVELIVKEFMVKHANLRRVNGVSD